MPVEIERKFVVVSDDWRAIAKPAQALRQGYLSVTPERTVRVRTRGDSGWVTIKGRGAGARRPEFEYAIPHHEAMEILDTLALRPLIEKLRYRVPIGRHVWEVDVFGGANQGLIVAEVELSHEDEPIELPSWVGREVTADPAYANAALVRAPFNTWN